MDNLMEAFYSKKMSKIIRQNQLILKNLNKQINKDLFKKLEIKYSPEIKTVDGRTFYEGDIIYRPLDGLKDDCNLDLNHYGIVLGTALNNEKLILHTTSKHNIKIVNLYEFLSTKPLSALQVERKPKEVSFEDIIKRAKQLQSELYSITDLNCRHFVNYCVYGKKESLAVQNICEFASPMLDLIAMYFNYKSQFQTEEYKHFFIQLTDKIDKINNEIKMIK